MEILSVGLGTGVTLGWWFTNLSFPLNDLLSFCIMTMAIKLVKFTSMQWAGSFMLFLLLLEVASTTALNLTQSESYSTLFIRTFNTPL
jgi:hypothetical protein